MSLEDQRFTPPNRREIVLSTKEEEEKQQVIEKIIRDFNTGYKEFIAGKNNSRVLYAGDFVRRLVPLELMIPTRKSEFTISYNVLSAMLFRQQAFLDRLGDTVESNFTTTPNGLLTPKLERLATQKPVKDLYVTREQSKLASPVSEVRLLVIDRYDDRDSGYPIAGVIFVRRMHLDRGSTDNTMLKNIIETGQIEKSPIHLLTAGAK